MPLEKERWKKNSWIPPWTRLEHLARYQFASEFVHERTVVDCACGAGMGIPIFLKKKPKIIYGFDHDSESIQTANKNIADSRVFLEVADSKNLPLPAQSCDVFIGLETIEHLEEDEGYLDEIARVLRPDGVVILSSPNRFITNPGTTLQEKPWNKFHFREYSFAEMKTKLSRRFIIDQILGQNPSSQKTGNLLAKLGKSIHRLLPVRINQALKCRWFLTSQEDRHNVVVCDPHIQYEYMVFVCRAKKLLDML